MALLKQKAIEADGHGDGALQFAAASASVNVIRVLLSARGDPNIKEALLRVCGDKHREAGKKTLARLLSFCEAPNPHGSGHSLRVLHCPLMSVSTHYMCDVTVGARRRGGGPSAALHGSTADGSLWR